MRPVDMFSAAAVAAIWGGNFVSAKYGMAYFSPFFLTSLRFFLVALILIAFVPIPTRQQMWGILQVALLLVVLHFAMLYAALDVGLDIASCSIVGQLGVPFSCLLSAIFHKDRLGPWRILGMAIAFVGMMVVAGNPNVLAHPAGFLIALVGAFCWGLSNLVIKRIQGVSNFQMLAWMGLFSVPQLWLVSALFEPSQWGLLLHTPFDVMVSIAYTVICSTIIAYGLWYHLLQKYPITMVTPYSLLAVPFSIAAALAFFGEVPSWQEIIGGVITMTGVSIIVIRRPKSAELGVRT